MNIVFLLIGGNIPDRMYYLHNAATLIGINIGRIVEYSPVYETAAWGNTQQPSFLNQALKVETTLSPPEVLEKALLIEKTLGRERTEKYGARTIDIDILLFNENIVELPDLQIPHPQMAVRRFVLAPLDSIAPDYHHPITGKTIHQLLEECPDPLEVKKYVYSE